MIDVKFSWNNGNSTKNVLVEETQSSFFKEMGKVLLKMDHFPDDIRADTVKNGAVKAHVIKRGYYIEDGKIYDSPFVQSLEGKICGLAYSEYPEAFLTCIHTESNNYKFYHIRPNNVGGQTINVGASYGRIGANPGDLFGERSLVNPIAPEMYWLRYYEKIAKGYKDVSSIMLSTDKVDIGDVKETTDTKKPKQPASQASIDLYELLMGLAKKTVEKALKRTDVTYKQVAACRKLFEDLSTNRDDVFKFNETLKDLVTLSPRRTDYVVSLFATRKEDIPRILDREEALINAMAFVLQGKSINTTSKGSFEDLDVEVWAANEWQTEHVLKRIPDSYKGYVDKIYRVIPKKRRDAFTKYVKAKGIDKKTGIHEEWHGSRNPNWGGDNGILANGLRLRNNAVRTGNMLGKDPMLYFADSKVGFLKSKGYTSWDEAYWTSDSSNIAVMALFAVATGKVMEQRTNVVPVSKAEMEKGGYNSVKAYKGAITAWGHKLRDSEIGIFDEDACECRYIVILKK